MSLFIQITGNIKCFTKIEKETETCSAGDAETKLKTICLFKNRNNNDSATWQILFMTLKIYFDALHSYTKI